jgi:hypothetical protein
MILQLDIHTLCKNKKQGHHNLYSTAQSIIKMDVKVKIEYKTYHG